MFEDSELLDLQLQEKLSDQIPSYFQAKGWKLFYNFSRDGKSYST